MLYIKPNDENFNSKGYLYKWKWRSIKNQYNSKTMWTFYGWKNFKKIIYFFTLRYIENETKDLIKFIADYFVFIMIAKDKNNPFEINPMIFFDTIFEFLFTFHWKVLRNPNMICRILSQKFLIRIETIFDKDHKVIQHLEIIDIIFLKFLNSCIIMNGLKKELD